MGNRSGPCRLPFGAGFRSFHGLGGSAPGLPETPVDTGGVVDCATCHDPGLANITGIRMPSSVMHPVNGVEASCVTRHRGRAAGATVAEAVGDLPDDSPNSELRVVNPHYATAAATWLGGYGAAGYHHEGRDHAGRFFHARPISSCVSCHQPHTLEVQTATCTTCHENGADPDLIRITRQSHDGRCKTGQGIRMDIASNAALLEDMVTRFAAEVAGTRMLHDGGRHPCFCANGNADGEADTPEGRPVAYANRTQRMLRAACDWKLVTADTGACAQNPHDALHLLHDSIADRAGAPDGDVEDLGLLRSGAKPRIHARRRPGPCRSGMVYRGASPPNVVRYSSLRDPA